MAQKVRALKTGIAYQVEQKNIQNYEQMEKDGLIAAIINWLNEVAGGDHPAIPGTDWKTFNAHVKDGIMLCKVLNKLLVADGKPPVSFSKKIMSPFNASTNIENFCNGLVKYGLKPDDAKFNTTDMSDGEQGQFYNAVTTLNTAAKTANGKSFTVKYNG